MSLLLQCLGLECWHDSYTFPQTQRRGQRKTAAAMTTGTYVVCLECGKEFPYCWKEMKIVKPEKATEFERIFELR